MKRASLFSAVCALPLLWGVASNPAWAQGGSTTDRSLRAQDFVNTFGVNVHLGEANYRNVQAIADALNVIGFSRVRIKCTDAADVVAAKELAAKTAPYFPAGLKADVLVIGYLNAPDVTLASQKKTIPQLASLIETLEGPNEINNPLTGNGTHGPFDATDQTQNFARNAAAWAKALALWKKSIPSLSKVRLLAPSIASGDPADYAKLPDISAEIDAGNFHFYAGNGRQPSGFGGGNFSAIHDWYKAAAAPKRQASVTEWGQTTAGKPGQGGCDEATQAKYILNQMFDIAAKGIFRAYLYQLMDDTADGDPTGNEGTEAHFGIFDFQWHPKPAAQALANLKKLLAEPPSRVTAQVPLTAKVPSYYVSGITDAGAAGSSLSLSKRDGSTFVVVWNEPQIRDAKSNAAVKPPADEVTVSFDREYAYAVYDPLIGSKAIAAGQGTRVRVNLSGSPLLIRVTSLR